MRVLFATYAEKTHFYNMVPLAWALRTAGHEVRVASQPALIDVIVKTGLTAVSVGTDHSWQEVMDEKVDDDDWGDRIQSVLTDPQDKDWDDLLGFFEESTKYSFRVFNDPMVDGLVNYAREWQPDLIIWESFTYAGAVAARVTGAAQARLLWGADVLTRVRQRFLSLLDKQPEQRRTDPVAEWLSETLGRYGATFSEEVITGQWTLDQSPASMRFQLGLPTVAFRYVPYNGPATIPDWLRERPERPRVCITAGTSMRDLLGYDPIPLSTLKAFDGLDIEIVATLVKQVAGNQVPEDRKTHGRWFADEQAPDVPDNVRLVDFVPMHAILPTCSAVVHIGSVGVVSTALLYGVPQLPLVPHLWDAIVRAEMLRDLGAGLYLVPDKVTAEEVRDNVVRLLEEPSFREAAQRLREEVVAEPTPNEIVPVLEKLTAENRVGQLADR